MEALGLDWKLLLAQIVNFGLLYFILKKLVFGPLIKAIDDRNKKIEGAVENSRQIEEKLQKVEIQKADLLEKAKREARKEKEELIEIAVTEKEKIISEARESAKREIKKGVESIELAKKEAVKEISDDYLDKITNKLYERFSEKSKKNDYPLLKKLLKNEK